MHQKHHRPTILFWAILIVRDTGGYRIRTYILMKLSAHFSELVGADSISAQIPGRGKPLPYVVAHMRNAVGADSISAQIPGRGKPLPYVVAHMRNAVGADSISTGSPTYTLA